MITENELLLEAKRLGADVTAFVAITGGTYFLFDAPRDYWWPAIQDWQFQLRFVGRRQPTRAQRQALVNDAWACISAGVAPWKWPSLEILVLTVEQLGGSAWHYRDSGRDFWVFRAPRGKRWATNGGSSLTLWLKDDRSPALAPGTARELQRYYNDLAVEIGRGFVEACGTH